MPPLSAGAVADDIARELAAEAAEAAEALQLAEQYTDRWVRANVLPQSTGPARCGAGRSGPHVHGVMNARSLARPPTARPATTASTTERTQAWTATPP